MFARVLFVSLVTLPAVSAYAAKPAGGQSLTSMTSTVALKEALKAELRDELRDELKAEIKAELAADSAATGPVEEDGWSEEEWKWEEPSDRRLNFLEFDGYFRFRYDVFTNLDLKTYRKDATTGDASGPYAPGTVPPVPICNTDLGSDADGNLTGCAAGAGESQTIGGANMRLRLEPVLNVLEDAKIKAQIDILDNVVLGSTPEGFPPALGTPFVALSQGQTAPSDGTNALADSIRVKRVWAEIQTSLGELRVGRMPASFGMGLLMNEGRGLDADYGDTVDRIMFATKIGDFHVIPAFDWAASGPTSDLRLVPSGQAFDRDQRDDVDEYVLAIVKQDTQEDIDEKLQNDEFVLNYGTYHALRFQALDAAAYTQSGDPTQGGLTTHLVERDARAWMYSLWVKLLWRKLSVEAEYAGIIGKIGNASLATTYDEALDTRRKIDINQHAAAINAEYKPRDDLTLRLLSVVASGDRAPGFGVTPFSSAVSRPGAWDGSQAPVGDNRISNFRVDPDFVVDMILWRQLVGTVTDALILRPGIQYDVSDSFGASLDLVYSRALMGQSTPSDSIGCRATTTGSTVVYTGCGADRDKNLGLEIDAKLFYDSSAGLHAWLQWGLLIPFGGLDRELDTSSDRINASIAQTLQAMVALSF